MKYRDLDGQFKEINIKTSDTLPVGSVVEYDGSTPPTGWSKVSDHDGNVIVSSEEPATGEEVWFQTSRNLFDRDNIIQNNSVDNNTGGVYEDVNSFTTNYIPVSSGKTYKFNGLSSSSGQVWGAFYDSNKNYIGKIHFRGFPKSIFIDNTNASYMRLGILNIYMDNFIIREANDKIHTKTDNGYEEFYNEENREVVLYDGDTTGDVTLKDSAYNYKYIEVILNVSNMLSNVKVPGDATFINCGVISCDTTDTNNPAVIIHGKYLRNKGTTLFAQNAGRIYKYVSHNTFTQDTDAHVYVKKVIGYKY